MADSPQLVLGPILRYVEAEAATIWVEVDRPCEVEIAGSRRRSFAIEGHHYALVAISGLEPGRRRAYEVRLDGRHCWPDPQSPLPESAITPPSARGPVRIAFGSCRVALPHEPPFVLDPAEDERGQGIDALRTLALGLAPGTEPLPDCLLMLGDQVYADDLSPRMRRITGSRTDLADAPDEVLGDYEEYALAYREAWGEPVIRWLLSTVPTAMIFDDHEVHAQWKLSAAWQRKLTANDWYERHISAGLMAYWVYQHLGNLSPRELADDRTYRLVCDCDGDAGPVLREQMVEADRVASHSRWSHSRDLGDSRLIVIDSRAGRELEPPERRMINSGEWEWVAGQARGDFEHLLLVSSVPFFLTPGLHWAEAWVAEWAEGRPGTRRARLAEWIRERAVMDHWASFPASLEKLCALLAEIAGGRHGPGSAPDSIVLLSGDVHHCYLAEVEVPGAPRSGPSVHQAVCSAYRKALKPRERRLMRFGNSRAGTALARSIGRLAGAPEPPARWRIVHEPSYDNQVALLELGSGRVELEVRTTSGCDWREPELREVFSERLLG